MEKPIRLSILVTFHKQKQYIKQSLNSILNQKADFLYEVLIGLDGSDDGSLAIIEEYLKKYPNIKLYQINQKDKEAFGIEKASYNRLNLLKNASGEYFCLLDGDDFYNNEKRFQTLVDILDQNPDCIGCGHDYIEFDDKTQNCLKIKSLKIQENKLDLKSYIDGKYHLFSNTIIFRNILGSEMPNDFPQRFFNDSTLTHYMLKKGKIYYLPEVMIAYRVNIMSIFSGTNSVERKISQLIAAEINHKIVPEHQKLISKKYKKLLFKCFLKVKSIKEELGERKYNIILKLALNEDCYFVSNILMFKQLSMKEKLYLINAVLAYLVCSKYPLVKTL